MNTVLQRMLGPDPQRHTTFFPLNAWPQISPEGPRASGIDAPNCPLELRMTRNFLSIATIYLPKDSAGDKVYRDLQSGRNILDESEGKIRGF